MTKQSTEHVVRADITVAAPPARAFAVFTEQFDSWWPRSHSVGSAPMAEAWIEPREGGRWCERGTDGSECDWGRVLAWDPPRRLVLLWQIAADWTPDPDLHTEVEITFTPDADGGTRVDVEHRGLDAYGARAAEITGVFASPQGWPGLLEGFAARAAA